MEKKFAYAEVVDYVRKAVQDRATWFYLLNKEMEAAGVNSEEISRRAVFSFGCMKGAKLSSTADIQQFVREFAGEISQGVFEMKLLECGPDKAVLEFNHCPLVECWQRLGADSTETDQLCDRAMEGDRGVMQNFPGIEMAIQKRIGAGDRCCRLVFTRKN